MKTVVYQTSGGPASVEYDETAPCQDCYLPIMEASMSGTDVCPWCDIGEERPEIILANRQSDRGDMRYHKVVQEQKRVGRIIVRLRG